MIDNGISPELRRFAEALVANVPADVAMLLGCLKCETRDELVQYAHSKVEGAFPEGLRNLTNATATREDYAAVLRAVAKIILDEFGPEDASRRESDTRYIEAIGLLAEAGSLILATTEGVHPLVRKIRELVVKSKPVVAAHAGGGA